MNFITVLLANISYQFLKVRIQERFASTDMEEHNIVNCMALNEITLQEDEAIIICVTPFSRGPIMQQIQIKGYIYNEDVYTMETYMSLKYVYELKKMYISHVPCFSISCICFLPTAAAHIESAPHPIPAL